MNLFFHLQWAKTYWVTEIYLWCNIISSRTNTFNVQES
jgi:hypothetical protein